MILTPPRINTTVNMRAASDRVLTSPKPTVDIVITVMYRASKKLHPSRNMYPAVPPARTKTTPAKRIAILLPSTLEDSRTPNTCTLPPGPISCRLSLPPAASLGSPRPPMLCSAGTLLYRNPGTSVVVRLTPLNAQSTVELLNHNTSGQLVRKRQSGQ